MSGLVDGAHKYFIVYHDAGTMHFEGYATLNDLALQAMFNECWKPDWEERVAKFKADLEERYLKHTHEHEWVDSVEGDNVVGKHCATCGEPMEYDSD